RGDILGLIGPNGAGKTTLFNAISGIIPVTDGNLILGQTDITSMSAARRARMGLGRTFQTSSVFDRRSVKENLWIAASAKLKSYVSWKNKSSGRRPDRKIDERVDSSLQQTGLEHRAADLAGQLSHG